MATTEPEAPASAADSPLIADYRAEPHRHDMLVDESGRPRPVWSDFLGWFGALGADGRAAVAGGVRRRIEESGAAYNPYEDPDQPDAARLDPLPVIVSQSDWSTLEQGLIQRATVIETVLRDVYGPQKLVRQGALPPSLVYGNPGFARACAGWPMPPDRFLQFYACDVAMSASGRWVVLGDDVETALGNGHVLANRVALGQAMGDHFQYNNVHRLAAHYAALQEDLEDRIRSDGRIVVLSGDPRTPGYFSSAYLARYLGATLVEAADLTVRGSKLFLKTLDGLQRVDLVIRKISSFGIDPLVGGNSAFGGTPGIIHAAGEGAIQFANAIGSGLLQGRTLAPFMAALCGQYLDEQPLLDESPALWLGDPANLWLARLPRIGPVGRSRRWRKRKGWRRAASPDRQDGSTTRPCNGACNAKGTGLPRSATSCLRRRRSLIGIGSLHGPGPCGPSWSPRRPVTGCFPAALGWVAASATGPVSRPAAFKDIWVQAEGRGESIASIHTSRLQTAHLRRTGRDLLSRSADNLYWLGRYAERTETTLRILRLAIARHLDDTSRDWRREVLGNLLGLHLGSRNWRKTSRPIGGWIAQRSNCSTGMTRCSGCTAAWRVCRARPPIPGRNSATTNGAA